MHNSMHTLVLMHITKSIRKNVKKDTAILTVSV
jgi:hypothetical protein